MYGPYPRARRSVELAGFGQFTPPGSNDFPGIGPDGFFPGPNAPLLPAHGGLAAIGRDAPVVDVPVTQMNPFNFDRYFNDMQSRYIWNKLLFGPKPLPDDPFYRHVRDPDNLTGLLDPRPMNPPEGAPLVEPRFR